MKPCNSCGKSTTIECEVCHEGCCDKHNAQRRDNLQIVCHECGMRQLIDSMPPETQRILAETFSHSYNSSTEPCRHVAELLEAILKTPVAVIGRFHFECTECELVYEPKDSD